MAEEQAIKSRISFINTKQLVRAILLCWRAQVPVCIIAGVGSGKTDAVNQAIELIRNQINDFKDWPVMLSLVEATDIGGFPRDKQGHIEYVMAKMLPFDCDDSGIIFADEFDRATPEVQNAFNYILLGKQFHGHNISPNAFPVMACNTTSDVYTSPISKATRNRVCFLYLSPDAEGDLESWDEWAETNGGLEDGKGIHPVIRGFAHFKPDLIEAEKDFEELAIPTKRSRDAASRLIQAAEGMKIDTKDIIKPCLAGVIGYAAMIELVAYQAVHEKLPDVRAILADPNGVSLDGISDDPSVMHAIGATLIKHTETRSHAMAAMTFAYRMPDEPAIWLARKIVEKVPNVVSSQEYHAFVGKHKELMQ